MHVVVKIHNNSLSRIVKAEDEDDAKRILIEIAQTQLQRILTDDEFNRVDNNMEYFNEDDPDNIYCISIDTV